MGETIDFASNGARATGWHAGSAGPGVVLVQEWWGLNDQIQRTADRLAGEGFRVLAPDLYHGRKTSSPDEAGKLLMALDVARAGLDLRGAIGVLVQETGGRVGVMGFCMGGALALYAACENPGDVAACVVFYGGLGRVSYDFDRLRGPVLGHWAEQDESVNARVPGIRAELEKRGLRFDFHTYPGTKHGFFNEDRPAHAPEASTLAWRRTVDFFAKELRHVA